MPTLLRNVTLAVLVLASGAVAAHGGRLNAEGCHNDRKHGGYHCHRGAASRPPSAQNFVPASGSGNALDAASGGSVYRNYTAARAAGAAPVHRGEPGYGPHLDSDNDGIGCEPYHGR
jgi:hypothetical protein